MRATSGSRLSVRTLIGNASQLMMALACVSLLASPALAEGKGKKSSEPKSVDDMMEETAKPKPKSDEDEGEAEAEPEEEEVPEPDEWEKPPEEEEKAPEKEVAAPVEQPTGDGRNFEVALLLGYGVTTDKGIFGPDPYGLGFGLKLGYELDFKLFVGLGFEYFLGSSGKEATSFGGSSSAAVDASANYMAIHAEAGYDFWITEVILRPSIWLGMGIGSQDPHPLNNAKKTISDFFFGPGVTVLYTTDSMFIGGDLRLLQVTGDGGSAISLFATGGMRF